MTINIQSVELRNITKRFPGVLANSNVNFQVRAGEIHALLGVRGPVPRRRGGRNRCEDPRFDLDPAATLRLHVTDRLGRPVVRRLFLGINGRGEKRTNFGTNVDADAEGHAVYKQILPGSYVLVVSQGSVGEATVETEVLPGENVLRLRLE